MGYTPLAFPHWLSDDGASGAGRDRTVLRCVFLAVSAMVLVACATITRGTTQVVAVDTPGAPGTSCIIQTQNGPQVVTTPGSVTLSRGSSSLPIQCTKECYLLGSSIIPSNAESMAAGNVIFGGIIGLGVDCRLRCDEQIPRRRHRRDDAGSGMPHPGTASAQPGTAAAHLGAVASRARRARRRGHFQRLALVTSSAMRFALRVNLKANIARGQRAIGSWIQTPKQANKQAMPRNNRQSCCCKPPATASTCSRRCVVDYRFARICRALSRCRRSGSQVWRFRNNGLKKSREWEPAVVRHIECQIMAQFAASSAGDDGWHSGGRSCASVCWLRHRFLRSPLLRRVRKRIPLARFSGPALAWWSPGLLVR